MMAARPVAEREWQPVLVAPFVAPFVVLLSRSNQSRAATRVRLRALSSGPAKAHPNSILTGWRAPFAHSLLRRQLLT
jgi:hypothetical protein